jgi:hypothetical protein
MANTSTEQVLKALAGLIPEDAQKSVEEAISKFLAETVAELEKEYSEKLDEAYKTVEQEKTGTEEEAYKGYNQAWEIITDLRDRLEIQKEEFEVAIEEGYEEAYQMLQEERSKNDTLEVGLYEEYDKRMSDVKSYMVDKIDQFLSLQGEKYYEMAKRDVLNDPAVTEHKLAFEKILEVAQNYLSDEDFAYATSSRIEGLQKATSDQQSEIKILQAKNMRLSTDNTRLTEALQHTQQVITESKGTERKERLEKAKKAEGRGDNHVARKDQKQVVIGEQDDVSGEPVTEQKGDERSQRFVEQIGEEIFADWKYLAKDRKNVDEDERNLKISTK